VTDPNEAKVREWRNKLQKAFLGKSALAESVSSGFGLFFAPWMDFNSRRAYVGG
jgi:hypothetical protein